jgi:kynurenine formamidase
MKFAADIASGAIKVVDLTQTLSEDTPVLVLPPQFGQCAAFSRQEISRYDERGIAWYWSNFTVSEHTGTHFDAPVHWISGAKLPDNSVDTVPVRDFIAPAVMLDFAREAAANPDFLLEVAHIEAWEAKHGKIPPRSWILFRTDWSKRDVHAYTNRREDGAHTPGPSVAMPVKRTCSILRIRPIRCFMAPAAMGCSAWRISIGCRPPASSSSPLL